METVTGVVEGFATIIAVISLGWILARVGLFDVGAQHMLSKLAFFVASPALMLTVLSEADVSTVFSANLVATVASVVVVVLVYALLARFVFRQGLADTVVGALSSSYVNAGNLGLPIAAYVLGDAALVAPALLLQMLLMQPLALTILDTAVAEQRLRWTQVASRPFRNPLTLGSIIGVLLSVTSTPLPRVVHDPLELVGGMAVPGMLIAYGISLRLGPRPGTGDRPRLLWTIVTLKMVVQPLVAYGVARYALGLEGSELLAVTVIAALPTAQNIFVIASRYGRATILSRDAIFASTLLSVPAVALIAALLA
ncbi:AEC family transporter [Aeromicrobium sp. Leaf350]|uniref:AEC family transporter n=1 Tax=Aeromicrobium sp. Leaf350 TaxID=2876565 RepID=UPI001E5396BE|nr:AEC family transporter [Aeromicrobium sp. Leaf350]